MYCVKKEEVWKKQMLSLLQELFERLGHLVGTGCGFHPAADPLHALDRLLHRHPFQKTGDALEIPAASPVTCTDWMIPSSAWISNCRAHTPLG